MTKIRKNLDLSPETVKLLNIEAAKKGTVFKLLTELILEDYAMRMAKKDNPKQFASPPNSA